jgi:hypothetical protein
MPAAQGEEKTDTLGFENFGNEIAAVHRVTRNEKRTAKKKQRIENLKL